MHICMNTYMYICTRTDVENPRACLATKAVKPKVSSRQTGPSQGEARPQATSKESKRSGRGVSAMAAPACRAVASVSLSHSEDRFYFLGFLGRGFSSRVSKF